MNQVTLDGLEIQVPPKGERSSLGSQDAAQETPAAKTGSSNVVIEAVLIRNARLSILPKDKTKVPLRFDIHDLRLESAGKDVAMKYTAVLTNPKPPGEIHASGDFGPWAAGEPGDTPLDGNYLFDHADLGIFNGIAGILRSTGKFEGSLSSITARGEATVPDFRLKRAGNPVPLSTTFEVLVDGTNGNTELKPVVATLGSTHFTTTGFVVRHNGDTRKTITLEALMPAGNLRDVLLLAMKGPPMMEGTLKLNTKIGVPPLDQIVKEKLLLDGTFEITNGKFLRSKIQEKINALSRRGQGKTADEEIDQAVDKMSGDFKLADESITFRTLAFAIPHSRKYRRVIRHACGHTRFSRVAHAGRQAFSDADRLEALGTEALGPVLFQTRSRHIPAHQNRGQRQGPAVRPRSGRHKPRGRSRKSRGGKDSLGRLPRSMTPRSCGRPGTLERL